MLFAYHYLQKEREEHWESFGAHMGTMWTIEQLQSIVRKSEGAGSQNTNIFVPLSLVMNPDLPEALLGKRAQQHISPTVESGSLGGGDGLNTEMPLPTDTEVVNMATLSKEEFFGLIANAGLATTTKK